MILISLLSLHFNPQIKGERDANQYPRLLEWGPSTTNFLADPKLRAESSQQIHLESDPTACLKRSLQIVEIPTLQYQQESRPQIDYCLTVRKRDFGAAQVCWEVSRRYYCTTNAEPLISTAPQYFEEAW